MSNCNETFQIDGYNLHGTLTQHHGVFLWSNEQCRSRRRYDIHFSNESQWNGAGKIDYWAIGELWVAFTL